MNKHFAFLVIIALLAIPAFAANSDLDFGFRYSRLSIGGTGFNAGSLDFNYNRSVYNKPEASFLKDLSLGFMVDATIAKIGSTDTGFINTLTGRNISGVDLMATPVSIGPTVRIDMPYSFFRLGLGFQIVRYSAEATGYESIDLDTKYYFFTKLDLGLRFRLSENWQLGLVTSLTISRGSSPSMNNISVSPYLRVSL